MSPRNRDVEKWHARAKRARERAVGVRDDTSKHMLLGIADAYDNLARRAAERGMSHSSPAGDFAQLSNKPDCDEPD
jgi:hypothetical protein